MRFSTAQRARLSLLLAVLSVAPGFAKIGYFWHITDIHYDVNYTTHGDTTRMCWRRSDSNPVVSVHRRPSGRFGDPRCDSPWVLVESAARAMRKLHGDNIEFVLWTGDAGGHYGSADGESALAAVSQVTELLRRTFSSQFVFPALGHSELQHRTTHHRRQALYAAVARLWAVWLPSEALATFEKGGYYTIEQKVRKLRLVSLNTQLYAPHSAHVHAHAQQHQQATHAAQQPEVAASSSGDDDPAGQWAWLEATLEKSMRNKETVYLIGHAPPGADEWRGGAWTGRAGPLQERHNRRFLHIVRKYANVIVGQFFGHLHADAFRVIYSGDEPVSWAFVAPSVSPWRPPGGASNPGLRLYKFDTDTGQVLDYTQFYLDLEGANQRNRADWQPEYNLSAHYGLHEVSARSLHRLAQDLATNEQQFDRYLRAASVQALSDEDVTSCDATCRQLHVCAITRLGYPEFRRCLGDAAALSKATAHAPLTLLLLPSLGCLLLQLTR